MATKKNEKNISKKDISNTSAKETFRNKIIRLLRDERTRFALFFHISDNFFYFILFRRSRRSKHYRSSIDKRNKPYRKRHTKLGRLSRCNLCRLFYKPMDRYIGILYCYLFSTIGIETDECHYHVDKPLTGLYLCVDHYLLPNFWILLQTCI